MAIFSVKGKKQQQDTSSEIVAPDQEACLSKDDSLRRSATSQLMQRDIARMTEQKIDAIEAAIANDYLKVSTTPSPISAPSSPLSFSSSSAQLLLAEELESEYQAKKARQSDQRDFPPTVFRFGKESILFADDDDAEPL